MRHIAILLILSLCSCGQKPAPVAESKPDPVTETKSEKERYEEMIKSHIYNGDTIHSDTINLTDANGLKQGFWKEYDSIKKPSGYVELWLVREGYYVDSKKWGLWREYEPSGKIKQQVKYESDKEVK